MQTRGALRSSPLPERAAGAELVLARGAAPRCGGGGRGRARDGVESAAEGRERERREGEREARRGPRPRPPPRAGGCLRVGTAGVPCRAAARARGESAGDGGRPPPPSPCTPSSLVCRGLGARGRRRPSLSPRRGRRAPRRPAGAPFRAVSAVLPFRFSSPGWGSPSPRLLAFLRRAFLGFPPLSGARAPGRGWGERRRRVGVAGGRQPAARAAAKLWACDLRSDVATR